MYLAPIIYVQDRGVVPDNFFSSLCIQKVSLVWLDHHAILRTIFSYVAGLLGAFLAFVHFK
jgi:hypothetical protein